MDPSLVATALAAARLRAVRLALLSLHKAILDAERERYERRHGRIGSAQDALQVIMRDPFFAWPRPLAHLIVQMDERTADAAPLQVTETEAFIGQVRALLQREAGGAEFAREYRRLLQEVPDVVVAHGRVLAVAQPATTDPPAAAPAPVTPPTDARPTDARPAAAPPGPGRPSDRDSGLP